VRRASSPAQSAATTVSTRPKPGVLPEDPDSVGVALVAPLVVVSVVVDSAVDVAVSSVVTVDIVVVVVGVVVVVVIVVVVVVVVDCWVVVVSCAGGESTKLVVSLFVLSFVLSVESVSSGWVAVVFFWIWRVPLE